MATTWIIDAYNFIRCSNRFAEKEAMRPEIGRREALKWLNEFSEITGFATWVVFDHYSTLETERKTSTFDHLKILESRSEYTADEEIIELAGEMGQRAVIVSSDREVQRGALQGGCSIMSSEEFEREVGKVFYAHEEEKEGGERPRHRKGRAFQPPKEKKKAYQLLRKFQ